MTPGDGMVDVLKKIGGLESGIVDQIRRREHRRRRNSAGLQVAREFVAIEARGPLGDEFVECYAVAPAKQRRGETRVGRPSGSFHRPEQRTPLLLGRDAQRDPRIVAARGKHAMRRHRRVVAGGARTRTSGELELDQRIRDVLHARFQLGDVNLLPFARGARVMHSGERAERREVAGVRIGNAHAMNERALTGIAAQARDSREGLADGGERNVVAPRTFLAEARHGGHHDRRIDLAQSLVRKPKLRHHARRVILHDCVAVLYQFLEQPHAFGPREIERQVQLVAVGGVKRRRQFVNFCRVARNRDDTELIGPLIDSTLITSAPRSAMIAVGSGPAQ